MWIKHFYSKNSFILILKDTNKWILIYQQKWMEILIQALNYSFMQEEEQLIIQIGRNYMI